MPQCIRYSKRRRNRTSLWYSSSRLLQKSIKFSARRIRNDTASASKPVWSVRMTGFAADELSEREQQTRTYTYRRKLREEPSMQCPLGQSQCTGDTTSAIPFSLRNFPLLDIKAHPPIFISRLYSPPHSRSGDRFRV
ncbi:hypothetical protein TSAR_007719, partial [Trichomalopsis sarcophagae]